MICIICGYKKEIYKSSQAGKYCSIKCVGIGRKGKPQIRSEKGKLSFRQKTIGKNNHGWKGDKVSYITLHHWMQRHLGKPKKCIKCGSLGGKIKGCHWANISGEYKRDFSDWHELCPSCNLTDGVKMAERFKKEVCPHGYHN